MKNNTYILKLIQNIYNTVLSKAMLGTLFEKTKKKAKNINRKTVKQDY